MKPGSLTSHSGLIGLIAAFSLVSAALVCALNDGLSLRAGDVEVNVQVSSEQGVALRFVHADS